MPEDELEALRISALLHDIGKIAIDDNILKKPAALTAEEYDIMKTHPVKGYKIMSQIPAMKDFLPGMYMHHEMVNGEGYPQGLKDEQIPLQAKIVSVADTFDAMTIDRPYSKGMLLPDAIARIREFVGTRYDAKVVEALVRGCEAGEIGRGVVQFMADPARENEKQVNVGVAQNLDERPPEAEMRPLATPPDQGKDLLEERSYVHAQLSSDDAAPELDEMPLAPLDTFFDDETPDVPVIEDKSSVRLEALKETAIAETEDPVPVEVEISVDEIILEEPIEVEPIVFETIEDILEIPDLPPGDDGRTNATRDLAG
jgi:hypothetical protein